MEGFVLSPKGFPQKTGSNGTEEDNCSTFITQLKIYTQEPHKVIVLNTDTIGKGSTVKWLASVVTMQEVPGSNPGKPDPGP